MEVNVSSMNANSAWLANTSHNIANINNIKAQNIDTNLINNNQSVSVSTTISKHHPTLDTQIPNLIIGERGVEANANAIKAQDEVVGTLLDLKA